MHKTLESDLFEFRNGTLNGVSKYCIYQLPNLAHRENLIK